MKLVPTTMQQLWHPFMRNCFGPQQEKLFFCRKGNLRQGCDRAIGRRETPHRASKANASGKHLHFVVKIIPEIGFEHVAGRSVLSQFGSSNSCPVPCGVWDAPERAASRSFLLFEAGRELAWLCRLQALQACRLLGFSGCSPFALHRHCGGLMLFPCRHLGVACGSRLLVQL